MVRLVLGTYFKPGPALGVEIVRNRRTIARGKLPAGYPDIGRVPVHWIALDRLVGGDQSINVCVVNRGSRAVALFGAADEAAPGTYATRARRRLGTDLDLVFGCGCERSGLRRLPDMLQNASLFKVERAGVWPLYVLLVLVLVAGPIALISAFGAAMRSRRSS